MKADEVRIILEQWKGVSFFPLNISNEDGNTFLAGTVGCMYDDQTDLIILNGLSYQHFNYQGKLEDLLDDYEVWR